MDSKTESTTFDSSISTSSSKSTFGDSATNQSSSTNGKSSTKSDSTLKSCTVTTETAYGGDAYSIEPTNFSDSSLAVSSINIEKAADKRSMFGQCGYQNKSYDAGALNESNMNYSIDSFTRLNNPSSLKVEQNDVPEIELSKPPTPCYQIIDDVHRANIEEDFRKRTGIRQGPHWTSQHFLPPYPYQQPTMWLSYPPMPRPMPPPVSQQLMFYDPFGYIISFAPPMMYQMQDPYKL